MTFDPTTLPACTQEDGSDPGQVFPCGWDEATQGNGQGVSFIMNAPDSWLYEDGTLICGRDLQANDAVDACEPITGPDVSPANEQAAPLTVPEQATTTQALVQPAAPAHAELAHTGPTDPALWLAALLMVTIGAVLAPVGKRRRSRSS